MNQITDENQPQNYATQIRNDGKSSPHASLPKSCLRQQQSGKPKKSVRFLPLPLTEKVPGKSRRNRKMASKAKEEEKFHYLFDKPFRNDRLYFNTVQYLITSEQPVLAVFQPKFDLSYLEYFISIEWDETKLSTRQKKLYASLKLSQFKIVEASKEAKLPPDEHFFVIYYLNNLALNDVEELTTALNSTAGHYHIPLIVGTPQHMLSLANQCQELYSKVRILDFLVTFHDIKTWKEGRLQTTTDVITVFGVAASNKEILSVWQEDYDKEYLVQLLLYSIISNPIKQSWEYNGVNLIDLARAYGCQFTHNDLSTVKHDETLSEASFDGNEQINYYIDPNKPKSLLHYYENNYITFPPQLQDEMEKNNAALKALTDQKRTPGLIGWALMEHVTFLNFSPLPIAASDLKPQLLTERFPFFKNSTFGAHVVHNFMRTPFILPKVTKAATQNSQTTMQHSNWRAVLHQLRFEQPGIPREQAKAPDYVIKVNPESPVLICIQLKSGSQNPSWTALLKELDKCPLMGRDAQNNRIFNKVEEQYVGTNLADVKYKMIFIFAAITHNSLENYFWTTMTTAGGDHNVTYDDSSFRFDRKFSSEIPEDVEVIVLREAGLTNLLGAGVLKFLQKYDPTSVHDVHAAVLEVTDKTDKKSKEKIIETDFECRAIIPVPKDKRKQLVTSLENIGLAYKMLFSENASAFLDLSGTENRSTDNSDSGSQDSIGTEEKSAEGPSMIMVNIEAETSTAVVEKPSVDPEEHPATVATGELQPVDINEPESDDERSNKRRKTNRDGKYDKPK